MGPVRPDLPRFSSLAPSIAFLMPDSAPFLFSEADLADIESGLPALVDGKPDQERFSGAIIEKQQELVSAVLADLVQGHSQRLIASKYSISRHTISGILSRAEASGKIAPYKQRLSAKLARAIEGGIEKYTEDLEAGKIQGAQIPVGIGILSDKKALIDGEATEVIEHRHTVNLETWRESLRIAAAKVGKSIQDGMQDSPTISPALDVQALPPETT